LGDLDHETQPFGLVVPAGIVSTTGIAGLTLGGGIGWLSRKYGLTADNLLSVDLVTAEGQLVHASADEHPDLFWGMRGGGGNLGIVTSFQYALQPLGPIVVSGLILHPLEAGTGLLQFVREFSASAPDELAVMPLVRRAPPLPFLPEKVHGTPVVGVGVCYAGSIEEGQRLVAPLKAYGQPLVDLVAPKPFTALQTMFDSGAPHGNQYYLKSEYLSGLSDGAIEAVLHHAGTMTSPLSVAPIFHLGGAVSRVAPDATAFGHRDAPYALTIQAEWVDPSEADRHVQWARDFWEAIKPYSAGGVYVNFISEDEGEDRVKAAYGSELYARLAALKAKYDPTNFFRLNQNIKPSA
jgi:FAD/FMN-containing dehydrogenase